MEIHYLTKKRFEPVLRHNPHITKIWLYDNNLSEILRAIKLEKCDYIIDLHHNLRSLIVKKKLRIKSFSFDKINRQKWLVVNLKINRLPKKHIVDRYMDTLAFAGIKNDDLGLEYYISDEDRQLPEHIKKTLPPFFIAFVTGAQHPTKKAPPAILADIINKIKTPVVLLGGPGDKEEGEHTLGLCKEKTHHNLCGSLSLNQSVHILEKARLVVAHDTGLMHIASALKKIVISLWGNTIPEFGMYPYLPDKESILFEVKNLSCRPCSKIGYKKCPKKHFDCMMKQDTSAIAHRINSLLQKEK